MTTPSPQLDLKPGSDFLCDPRWSGKVSPFIRQLAAVWPPHAAPLLRRPGLHHPDMELQEPAGTLYAVYGAPHGLGQRHCAVLWRQELWVCWVWCWSGVCWWTVSVLGVVLKWCVLVDCVKLMCRVYDFLCV